MATTKELVEQINLLFTENRMGDFMDYLADDVVWDMYTSSSGHSRFNGKSEIGAMDDSNMPEHTDFRFTTIVIDNNLASVQGSSTSQKAGGEQYESNFCDIYQFEGDKIIKITSYVVDNT
ncbi:nuclear transport factor 2 family protein [Sphingobacterium shayense]|uniref:nuclear transport factor 2 family protein n=1 Tax=Sphingobacterium shayense TaxID=626343 RepID=UPI0015569335|nr:nuclear transport factor 2 family protein [Sphingobacterium shayense]NQD72602.1 nuclear transport factor 2 family protein [Sphingobacterium shayense]